MFIVYSHEVIPGDTIAICETKKIFYLMWISKYPMLRGSQIWCGNIPCRSWTSLQWKNPWGLWSKCSFGKECDHCSFPVNGYTPTGYKRGNTSVLSCCAYIFNGEKTEYFCLLISHRLPWEPEGCGWSRQFQLKYSGHCCWHLYHAHCQPNRPVKTCRAAW